MTKTLLKKQKKHRCINFLSSGSFSIITVVQKHIMDYSKVIEITCDCEFCITYILFDYLLFEMKENKF